MNLWTKVYIVFINFVETLLLIFTFMDVKKKNIYFSIDSTYTHYNITIFSKNETILTSLIKRHHNILLYTSVKF